jgi:hypothetical protein
LPAEGWIDEQFSFWARRADALASRLQRQQMRRGRGPQTPGTQGTPGSQRAQRAQGKKAIQGKKEPRR